MARPFDVADIWRLVGNGNQMNPRINSQLFNQAAPDDADSIPSSLRQPQEQIPPLLDKNMPLASPPITPVENSSVSPYTVQPTTNPLGSTAQEIAPQQPAMMSPWFDPASQLQNAYGKIKFKAPKNDALLKAIATAESNYGDTQKMHQQEIDKLKEGLADYAGRERGINFTPLATLSDAWFGGNLTKAAESMAPETAAQKSKNMQDMQDKIAQYQGEIPKEQLDLMKTKLTQMGFMDQRALEAEQAKLSAAAHVAGAAAGQQMQGARLGLQKERLGLQVDKEARGTVNNDAMLKQYGPRLEGAAKIGELIDSANKGKVVSNQALLGQVNAEISRLETGSQSPGLHASEKTELQDSAAQLSAFRDSITGKPEDAVHPEVLAAAGKMVNELSTSYMRGIDSRMEFLKSGMTPAQAKIASQKHQVLRDTYAPRFGGWHGLNEVQKSSKPKVVEQNGHTYRLNEQSGEYE